MYLIVQIAVQSRVPGEWYIEKTSSQSRLAGYVCSKTGTSGLSTSVRSRNQASEYKYTARHKHGVEKKKGTSPEGNLTN